MGKPNASPTPPLDEDIVINGKRYCQVQMHCISYSVSSHKSCKAGLVPMAALLVMMFTSFEKSDQTVDVCGIDNHQITNIPNVTAGGVVKTQHGPAITILHQYA